MAGSNGGGSFVIIYLFCSFLIVMPILVSEVLIGRRGTGSPVNALKQLCKEHRLSAWWKVIGWAGISTGIIILSYYSVIGGWIVGYTYFSASGGLAMISVADSAQIFEDLTHSPHLVILLHTIFMLLTAVIVGRGLSSGIEKAVRYFVPLMFLALLALVVYAAFQGSLEKGARYMFTFDPDAFNSQVFLVALGQAFFSLSIGMGAAMMYGAYLPRGVPIIHSCVAVVAMDVFAALLSGLVIFSLVFQVNLDPAQGPGLVFETLPLVFDTLPGGQIVGVAFFVLMLMAGLTSAIALLEPGVVWFMETTKSTRVTSTFLISLLIWLLGFATVYSFSAPESWQIAGKTFFEIFDSLTTNFMLPLGGIMIALFAGWSLPKYLVRDETGLESGPLETLMRFSLRYLAPLCILLVVWNALGF